MNVCECCVAFLLNRPQITLSKYMQSDTGVTCNITLQPVISVVAGSKLVVTVTGDLTPTAGQAQIVTTVFSPFAAGSISSRQFSREFQFTFNVNIAANSIIKFAFGTFSLPSLSLPGSDGVDAALVDPFGKVVAPSSSGSFPAIFDSPIINSLVSLSSSVANTLGVTVTVKLDVSIPSQKISMFRLSGLGFVALAESTTGRRLLQNGISCSNLDITGVPSVNYFQSDGELVVTFPGVGGATISNPSLPAECQISGFRNPAAAVESPGVIVTTYDENQKGYGIESGVVFPAILCAPGYFQNVTGNSVSCIACPKGTYGELPGAEQCLLCRSGTYSPSEAATSPLACTPCPVGEFSNKTGATDASVCTKCLPGTKNSMPGASECSKCTNGTYGQTHGLSICNSCDSGTFTMEIGATSRSSCSLCAAGTYSLSGAALCTRCAPGTDSIEGSGSCKPCEKGEYSTYGECILCPSISFSLNEGSTSLSDCTGIRVVIGEDSVAYTIGIIILVMYILSFSFVPAWSASDTVMRFALTANFEGRLKKKAKRSARRQRTTWSDRISDKLFKSSNTDASDNVADEKRFFEVGDSIMWDGFVSDGAIGTVESTSVYPEQDADEFGNFVVFLKIEQTFTNLTKLSDAVKEKTGDKPILIDSRNHGCRCQLLDVPQSHARMFGFQLGRWELVRQISACFQLLLLSFFPAVDTITDLVYILSQIFFNFYLFAASVLCITAQFWVFVTRLKKRRVFEVFKERKIELAYLKGLSWWPKWASPDSLPVFLVLVVPFYFVYHIVFPVVWFFIGYIIYSFQLFPISRISNRWLYLFVYKFAAERDSDRRRFDTSDAIILPMVQKGKVEETILESVPQLVIQLINGYLLGEIGKMPLFAIFSISLSVLSLSNTIWYYAYWNLFRCKPIRDVPSSLSLYNYKLAGVKDGMFSFGKTSHEVELAKANMLSVTVAGTALNDHSRKMGVDSDEEIGAMPRKARELEMEVIRPDQNDLASPVASNSMAVIDSAGVGAGEPSLVRLEAQLAAARSLILKLEEEKLRMAKDVDRMKHDVMVMTTSPQTSAAAVSPATDAVSDRQDHLFDTVLIVFYLSSFLF